MADFILILFEADNGAGPAGGPALGLPDRIRGLADRALFKAGLYKTSLCTRLFLWANRGTVQKNIKKVELSGDINAWIIKLPITLSRLSAFSGQAVRDHIVKLCRDKRAQACFMPGSAAGQAAFEDFNLVHASREAIYKAHLLYILDDIYENNGVRIGTLDTVIIEGEDSRELCSMVRRLEPRLKYLTVATQKNGGMERELADISAETGLMVGLSSSWKPVLRNADLIINLAGAAALSGYRIKPSSLVLNFNTRESMRIYGENTVINGIEYVLPAEVFARLGTEVLRSYSKKEITEAVMDLKLGSHAGETPADASAGLVLEEFGKCGCRIIGYTGRRGVIKARDISEATAGNMPGPG